MAKERYRVKAEGAVVLGHKEGEDFSFPDDEQYNVEALLEAGIIEPVKASSSEKKED